ncbi:dihydroxyacetone kinase [Cavenderia fasciculata]|uniref:Dihydroxyacetone kinase n=1 Tax=Cavenderia fasciculata TaxID=261658 RepID=F4QAJ0_CACFS|nr:dihydroxyacetone kinase [Cavenderia fasciculata]EGG15709.1 dihydroxyacetone kinase [Cavenderia fasciculata]|eukprot:XP_004354451.1 dihydroxyacetone kinase [Cavenderia fasciculata]
MKKIINDANNVVNDMIDGMIMSNPLIKKLLNHNVIVRADTQQKIGLCLLTTYICQVRSTLKDRVALISGGGSGHEPSHAGFVGMGMLSAAVLGDVFTSPSPSHIVAAIHAVTGRQGCLLIVKNYTGDRLNFGIAAETANSQGFKVRIVIVGDDISSLELGSNDDTKRRGVAGTVLLHKILGAMAEQCKPLDEIEAMAKQLCKCISTLGVGLSSCTIPRVGHPSFQLGESEIEIGLGIHGEQGIKRQEMVDAKTMAKTILDRLLPYTTSNTFIVLLNNLGSTTNMELSIFTKQVLEYLNNDNNKKYSVIRFISGTLMTALEMSGISLTLLSIPDNINQNILLDLIDFKTLAMGWPVNSVFTPLSLNDNNIFDYKEIQEGNEDEFKKSITIEKVDADLIKTMIETSCQTLMDNSDVLTELDSKVGDGDLGITLDRASKSVLANLESLDFTRPCFAFGELSKILVSNLGGSSGPFYGIFFLKLSTSLFDQLQSSSTSQPTRLNWIQALKDGCGSIQQLGGGKVGDCTMLDALVPAIDSLYKLDHQQLTSTPLTQLINIASDAAHTGSLSTIEMVAKVGRAAYLGDRARGTMDPGAHAIDLLLSNLKNK